MIAFPIRKIIAAGLLSMAVLQISGQTGTEWSKDSITTRFLNQALLYPQEKIHLQTDKPHYLSGERIWLKVFLVDAMLHIPNCSSRYIYVELIDPLKQVQARVKLRTENDSFHGYVDLPEDLIEGNYTLRAYTAYMRNWDKSYWPHVPVYVSDPQAANINIAPRFEYDAKNKVSLSLSITNINNNTIYTPKVLSVTYDNKAITPDDSSNLTFNIHEGENTALIECDKYRKYISIPNPQSDYEISFFPEGGNMLAETVNCIAFKSLYGNGNPANISGYIVDEKGSRSTGFTTYHDGMGLFFIKPEAGTKYYAITTIETEPEKKFELPLVIKGAGLRISNMKNNFSLSISRSSDTSTDSLYIVMHTRGILQYAEKWNNEKNEISFRKGMFLSGVLHILLTDSKGHILSERLIFCNNDDQARVNKEISPGIKTRGHVSVNLQISDRQEKSLEADLLVSITDNKDVDATINNSILSTLLLTSDIRGYIPKPNFYFEKDNPKSSKALDLLMLTHGWRRYDISAVMQGRYEKPAIAVETGQEISGRVSGGLLNKPAKDSEISIFSRQTGFFDMTATDDKGRFSFRNFEFPDSVNYTIQALNRKGSSHVELVIDKETFPSSETVVLPRDTGGMSSQANNKGVDSVNRAYISKANWKYTYENGMRMVHLNPVEVRAKKKVEEKSFYDRWADKNLSEEFIRESGAATISDVMRYISGFTVENGTIYGRISSFRDRVPVMVFVDGTHVTPFEEQAIDDLMPIQDIQEIAVFKSLGKSLMLGIAGGGPAIVIATKKGGNIKNIPPDNIALIRPLGYQKPAEFYAPRYDTQEAKNNPTPDLRTTIYWNPALRPNGTGNARFYFYTADSPGEYTMIIEGITKNGEIIYSVDKLRVSK